MPLKINVPYAQKDIAKAKGAFWDVENKTWFIPDNRAIEDFLPWIDTDKVEIIVKSPFYIGISSHQCYSCGYSTTVIALAGDNFYYFEDSEQLKIREAEGFSFFPMPTYIDEDTVALLARFFPSYKLGYSKTVGLSYWANHCEHCGKLQGDFFLHAEPDGAFFPMAIADVKKLQLIAVETRFDVELRADIPGVHNEDEIFEHSNIIDLEDYQKGI